MSEHAYLDLVPAYCAGALSPEDASKFRNHSGTCELCESEIFIAGELINRLPYGLKNHRISAGMKDKLRARIEENFPARQETLAIASWRSSWRIGAASAAAILILGAFAELYRENSLSHSELLRVQNELQSAQLRDARSRREVEWLFQPAVQVALLSSTANRQTLEARVVFNRDTANGMFYCSSIPSLDPGQQYQLWLIDEKGPVSAGLFEPSANGDAVIRIHSIDANRRRALQFAVSIEPRGGRPQPTGDVILAGKVL